jgi:signal transduction histidine kinase
MEPVVGRLPSAGGNEDPMYRYGPAGVRADSFQPATDSALSREARKTIRTYRPNQIRNWWLRRSLFEQFAMTSSVVLTLSVVAVGGWVGARISDGVLRGTSGAAALYLTNFVEPHIQSIDTEGSPTPEEASRLDAVSELLKSRRHVVSIKIWRPDGTIVYSTQKSLVGKQFPTTEILPSLDGKIRAGMADFDDDDSEFERSLSIPLYEIFLPLYKSETEKIIAVAEIYEDARALLRDQASAVGGAWLVVGSAGLCTLLILFAIVYRGSLTIRRQRAAIKRRFREQLRLHRHNDELQLKVQEALRRSTEIGDLVQTRIGVDLHDGPAQLMSHVLLRLDEVEGQLQDKPSSARALVEQLRCDTKEALKELRAISAGLFLPDIGDTGAAEKIVQSIVFAHESRTNCKVAYRTNNAPKGLSQNIVRCIARVVQEALNNSYKHSSAMEQSVLLFEDHGVLHLSIGDTGRGMPGDKLANRSPLSGLGIPGMASRVEALGGSFAIRSVPGMGTEVVCGIPIQCSRSPGAGSVTI